MIVTLTDTMMVHVAMSRSWFTDLEDWFAAQRDMADWFGMEIRVLDGELVLEAK